MSLFQLAALAGVFGIALILTALARWMTLRFFMKKEERIGPPSNKRLLLPNWVAFLGYIFVWGPKDPAIGTGLRTAMIIGACTLVTVIAERQWIFGRKASNSPKS